MHGSPTHAQKTTAGLYGLEPGDVARKEAQGLKFCGGCRQWLAIVNYYRKGDGRLLNTCKSCRRQGAELHYRRELKRALTEE